VLRFLTRWVPILTVSSAALAASAALIVFPYRVLRGLEPFKSWVRPIERRVLDWFSPPPAPKILRPDMAKAVREQAFRKKRGRLLQRLDAAETELRKAREEGKETEELERRLHDARGLVEREEYLLAEELVSRIRWKLQAAKEAEKR